MTTFRNELHFENYISGLIKKHITAHHPDVYVLKAKKTVDIVICKDSPSAQVFFLELKYFNKHKNHSMLAFGGRKGTGFQPEVLKTQPKFFRNKLRWVMGSATHDGIYFLPMHRVLKHLSGNAIGEKQNGFRRSLLDKEQSVDEAAFVDALKSWLGIRN